MHTLVEYMYCMHSVTDGSDSPFLSLLSFGGDTQTLFSPIMSLSQPSRRCSVSF